MGENNYDPKKLISFNDKTLEDHRLEGTPYTGEYGLAEAIRKKVIRRATKEDLERWISLSWWNYWAFGSLIFIF
mgnify:CR=1 FL=1